MREVDLLRQAGELAASILMKLKTNIVEGMTTKDIDQMAARMMKENRAIPSFLNYRGYPATVCTSINDEIVHAIPGNRKLLKGDLLSLVMQLVRQRTHLSLQTLFDIFQYLVCWMTYACMAAEERCHSYYKL